MTYKLADNSWVWLWWSEGVVQLSIFMRNSTPCLVNALIFFTGSINLHSQLRDFLLKHWTRSLQWRMDSNNTCTWHRPSHPPTRAPWQNLPNGPLATLTVEREERHSGKQRYKKQALLCRETNHLWAFQNYGFEVIPHTWIYPHLPLFLAVLSH